MTTNAPATKTRMNQLAAGMTIARPDTHILGAIYGARAGLRQISCGLGRATAERRIAKGDTVTVDAVRIGDHFEHVKGAEVWVTIDGVEYNCSSNQIAWVA